MFKFIINKIYKFFLNNFQIYNLIKISLFKNLFLFFNFFNIFQIYNLNKNCNKSFYICDMLTFNFYNKKKTFIFLNYNLILKKSKKKKIKPFIFFIYSILHCILHSQNFKDNNLKNSKIMNFFHNKIMKKYGFYLIVDYRIRTYNFLITNQKLYQLS